MSALWYLLQAALALAALTLISAQVVCWYGLWCGW
jgi:hypothetical protein